MLELFLGDFDQKKTGGNQMKQKAKQDSTKRNSR